MFSEKKARKWMWVGLGAFAALQIYFVQELLAALLLFTGAFILLAIVVLVLYLVDRAGQRSLTWAEQRARPALQLARRGWTAAEELSKKPFRRPRSEPAQ
jgi:predicted lysophospholipase L1 biosynthesis ABC-type transport system permease subunit